MTENFKKGVKDLSEGKFKPPYIIATEEEKKDNYKCPWCGLEYYLKYIDDIKEYQDLIQPRKLTEEDKKRLLASLSEE